MATFTLWRFSGGSAASRQVAVRLQNDLGINPRVLRWHWS
jgi:hypothetical protein